MNILCKLGKHKCNKLNSIQYESNFVKVRRIETVCIKCDKVLLIEEEVFNKIEESSVTVFQK